MQISKKLNIVFIRIPKTATSTVSVAITKIDPDTPHKNGIHHYHERFTVEHQKEFKDYFSFTIVRNTYDRLVSWYYFEKEGTSKQAAFAKNLSLKRRVSKDFSFWIECLISDYEPVSPVFCTNAEKSWYRICPYQLDYFTDDKRNVLVNKVIDYKDIDIEIPKIIGSPITEVRNKIGDYDKNHFFDDRSLKLINKIFEEELEYFKWKR